MSSDLAPETPAAPPAAKGAAGKLQKKIGPLPLWLWIGIGGGLLLLVLRRGAGASQSSGDPSTSPAAASSSDGLQTPDLGVGGAGSGPVGNVGGFEDPAVSSFDPSSLVYQPLDPSTTDNSTSPNPAPTWPTYTGPTTAARAAEAIAPAASPNWASVRQSLAPAPSSSPIVSEATRAWSTPVLAPSTSTGSRGLQAQ